MDEKGKHTRDKQPITSNEFDDGNGGIVITVFFFVCFL